MTRLRRAICCAIDKCYPRVMSCDVRHRDGDAGTYQNATERSPSVKAMGGRCPENAAGDRLTVKSALLLSAR